MHWRTAGLRIERVSVSIPELLIHRAGIQSSSYTSCCTVEEGYPDSAWGRHVEATRRCECGVLILWWYSQVATDKAK